MPTNHDAVGALPETGGADRELLRALLFARMAYVLADTENPQDLVAVDPESGSVIVDIVFKGRIYHYDANDTITPHDGTAVLVTQGGRRYKLNALSAPLSVKDKDLTAPPVGPTLGDAYLINSAPSGGWSTFSVGDIVVLTARGWERIIAPVGSSIYVMDEAGYYHRNASNNWVAGFGATPVSNASVPLASIIAAGRYVAVENQTTNTPPTSPQGTAYIIGPAPTGAWAGHPGKIAIREAAGSGNTYVIYAATDGFRVYDKSQGFDFQYHASAGAWRSAAGRFRINIVTFQNSGTWTKPDRLFRVIVHVVGGGGGGRGTTGNGSSGFTSSFGSHCNASGGNGGTAAAGGAAGNGNGGDQNFSGRAGWLSQGGDAGLTFGPRGSGGGAAEVNAFGGGGGGAAIKSIAAADLGTNESVTIGGGGTAGSGGTSQQGIGGIVVIHEYIEE